MSHWHVPGVSLAIIDSFRIVYARGFGVAEMGQPLRVDTNTLFLAGSISKAVFATGALRLAELGEFRLDDDVNAHLLSWRVPASRFTSREKVTLRRILAHTAGLTVWGFPGYPQGSPLPTIRQVLDGAPPARTSAVGNDTTPGSRWLYSGGGYVVAQVLATDATGQSFPELMQRLVLATADMPWSTYENPLPIERHASAASGHEKADTPVPGRFHTYPEMAAAGLWTTAPDLARWGIALSRAYNSELGLVISPEMAREMIAPSVRTGRSGEMAYWGLGVTLGGAGDSIRFGHGGRDEGFVAQMTMWPGLGRGFVVLTNGSSGALLREISRAFTEVYGMSTPPRSQQK